MNENVIESTYKDVVLMSKDYDKVNGYQARQDLVESLRFVNERAGLGVELVAQNEAEGQKNQDSIHLPIHQVLDMAIFAIEAINYLKESYRYPGFYEKENLLIKRVALQGESMGIQICEENETIDRDIKTMIRRLGSMDEMLAQRLRVLEEILCPE